MERTIALKKLSYLLGKKLGYRIDARAPTPDERMTAKAMLAPAIEEHNKLKERRDTRYKAILEADAEYQDLLVATRAASKRADELLSITRHYKITVGTSGGMFFHVRADGDSWEDVIDKLTTKKKEKKKLPDKEVA